MGGTVADNTAEKLDDKATAAPADKAAGGEKKSKPPLLLLGVVVVNTLALIGMGYMIYSSKKAELTRPSMEPLVEGGLADRADGTTVEKSGFSVPLDYFLVNLAEDQGQKLFKVEMEFDVDSVEVQEEITKRMPQVRDIIIILLSSKEYSQISTPRGKENLKEEIRDTVNSFLTKGKINKVLFTQFINS